MLRPRCSPPWSPTARNPSVSRRAAEPEYGTVVVGAGSSGAAYAARAAERRGGVLLVEAGPAHLGAAGLPAVLLDGTRMAAAVPGGPYTDAHTARFTGGPERTIVRGRGGGGSGALNGGVFTRALPADFAAFAADGRDAWSYAAVLPFLTAMEDDRDFGGPLHGSGGPVPVRRAAPLLEETEAFLAACRAAGHPAEDDKNAGGPPGAGRVPLNVVDGVRHSTALTHLAPAASRPGLEVRADTAVLRVELDRTGRARGVVARTGGGPPALIRADAVVLCAGAVHTPRILLRSGITEGVGAGVQDHAMVMVSGRPARRAPRPPGTAVVQAALHTPDLEIMPYTASFAELIGPGAGDGGAVPWGVTLLRPRSRGTAGAGGVEHRHLACPHDRARLADGVRLCAELMSAAGLEPVPVEPAEAFAAAHATTAVHLSGGAAMGRVTDQWGRVSGTEGLSVADASLLPRVPSRGLNHTAVLIGERLGRA